jgi:hypothetical protein
MNVFAILSELHAERRRIISEIQSLERSVPAKLQLQTNRRRSRKAPPESHTSREVSKIAGHSNNKLRLSLLPRTIG